ncbi:hypothetical protein SMD44_07968 [Streptomyces alboflavus]|uniref:Uncharacterized protein n=1 Tax=Streptomyces alboflavus TaxID=67267 RepID=A0A1Z1WPU6_9ACTN|nr:hypothetical protein SMD44_07968 [Streptomyces alboflavus]
MEASSSPYAPAHRPHMPSSISAPVSRRDAFVALPARP